MKHSFWRFCWPFLLATPLFACSEPISIKLDIFGPCESESPFADLTSGGNCPGSNLAPGLIELRSWARDEAGNVSCIKTTNFMVVDSSGPLGSLPLDRELLIEVLGRRCPSDPPEIQGSSGWFDPTENGDSGFTRGLFVSQARDVTAVVMGQGGVCFPSTIVTGRIGHTATLLQDGRLLIAGGYNPAAPEPFLSSAQIFDPSTGEFGPESSLYHLSGSDRVPGMTLGRAFHTATLLPSGEVLIAGGLSKFNNAIQSVVTAEIFDPRPGRSTSNTFSYRTDLVMNQARAFHTATLVLNQKVILIGGFDHASNCYAGEPGCLPGIEIFRLSSSGFDQALTAGLGTPRALHTATLTSGPQISRRDIIIAGGRNTGGPLAEVEVYRSDDEQMGVSSTLQTARWGHAAASFSDGTIVITGGCITDGCNTTGSKTLNDCLADCTSFTATAEIYDPGTGSFNSFINLEYGRAGHTATRMENDSVALVGGFNENGIQIDNNNPPMSPIEFLIVSGGSGNVVPANPNVPKANHSLIQSRWGHTATGLTTGLLLMVGGEGTGGAALDSAEYYNPGELHAFEATCGD